MSCLAIYLEAEPIQPTKLLNHVEDIQAELQKVGVRFEQWTTNSSIQPGAEPEAVLAAYAEPIQRLQQEQGYLTVDVISMDEKHPEREALRQKFLSEHQHSEDEVRFFVAGQGLFSLHIADQVYVVLCRRGDLISVPAGVKHWFDMGERPRFVAVRLFNNPEGWVANFTGDAIADEFPQLDDFL